MIMGLARVKWLEQNYTHLVSIFRGARPLHSAPPSLPAARQHLTAVSGGGVELPDNSIEVGLCLCWLHLAGFVAGESLQIPPEHREGGTTRIAVLAAASAENEGGEGGT
jgi:hypothetical protein